MAGDATLGNGTCVMEGRLAANARLDSFVIVERSGSLRGAGIIAGPVTVNGRLAPGNSPGTLTASSTVTMTPGSELQIDINGTGTGNGAGNYSRLVIVGNGSRFVARGATVEPTLLNISAGTFVPYVPQVGDSFRIVTAEGGIDGQFAALTQPEGPRAAHAHGTLLRPSGRNRSARARPVVRGGDRGERRQRECRQRRPRARRGVRTSHGSHYRQRRARTAGGDCNVRYRTTAGRRRSARRRAPCSHGSGCARRGPLARGHAQSPARLGRRARRRELHAR